MSTLSVFRSGSPYVWTMLYSDGGQISNVSKAVLTEELNRAGSLALTLHGDAIPDAINGRFEIFYDIPGREENRWVGRPANYEIINEKEANIVYEGLLSYPSKTAVPPYSYTGNLNNYFNYLWDYYSDTILNWSSNSIGITLQTSHTEQYTRSSDHYTTAYDEISEKIFKRYNDVWWRADFNNGGGFGTYVSRRIYFSDLPSEVSDTIYSNDIISASFNTKLIDRAQIIYGIGAQTSQAQGDANRIHRTYRGVYTDTEVLRDTTNMIRKEDVSVSDTLYAMAEAEYTAQKRNTENIEIKFVNDLLDQLRIGYLYRIVYPIAGIDGVYRLVKKTTDILNPSRSSCAFGSRQNDISAKR